jgi:hypothetical protein
MIDKIWYDWQMRDPLNAQSFFGGSLESINNLTVYNENPTGVGPYLDVSTRILGPFRNGGAHVDLLCIAELNHPCRRFLPRSYYRRHVEHNQRRVVL